MRGARLLAQAGMKMTVAHLTPLYPLLRPKSEGGAGGGISYFQSSFLCKMNHAQISEGWK